MTENDMRLHFMGEAQEATDEVVGVIEAMCSMCAAAGIDYGYFLAQIVETIVEQLEA